MAGQSYIPRLVQAVITPYAEPTQAIYIAGPRQAGKSTLMHHLNLSNQTQQYV